jgi:DNA polymerase epsilon subunit 4
MASEENNNTTTEIASIEPKVSSKVIERTPGSTMLPIARIKRVIKEDKDVSLINAEATFCIAYATVR